MCRRGRRWALLAAYVFAAGIGVMIRRVPGGALIAMAPQVTVVLFGTANRRLFPRAAP